MASNSTAVAVSGDTPLDRLRNTLSAIREKKGLTYAQLAESTGVPGVSLQAFLGGKGLGFDYAVAVIKAFNIKTGSIIG